MHFNSMAIGVGKRVDFNRCSAGLSVFEVLRIHPVVCGEIALHVYQERRSRQLRFSHLLPEASSTARTLSKTDRHCASKSNSRKFPLWSSFKPGTPLSLASEPAVRGPTPDKKSKLPTLRACGYEPTGFGALAALIFPEVDMFD